jgi:hypothetical protein
VSAGHRIEHLRTEIATLLLQLDEVKVRLLCSEVAHRSEALGRQAATQIRHIVQGGFDTLQKTHFQLLTSFKARLSEHDVEKLKLLDDIRIFEEFGASQKQLIENYEAREQHQQQLGQSACHVVEDDPMLSQYNNRHHSSQGVTYGLPRYHDEILIDPSHLHPLPDIDYSIGSPLVPIHKNTVMSTPATDLEYQAAILQLQSTPHPIATEHDCPDSSHAKGDSKKRELEADGGKPSKKRKTK